MTHPPRRHRTKSPSIRKCGKPLCWGGGARAPCGRRPEPCARLLASPSRPGQACPKAHPMPAGQTQRRSLPSGPLPLTQLAESPAPGPPPGRTGRLGLAPLPLGVGEPRWAGGTPLGAQPAAPLSRLWGSRTLRSLKRQSPSFGSTAPSSMPSPKWRRCPRRLWGLLNHNSQQPRPEHNIWSPPRRNATINLGAAGQASPLCPGQPALLWLPSWPLPSCGGWIFRLGLCSRVATFCLGASAANLGALGKKEREDHH